MNPARSSVEVIREALETAVDHHRHSYDVWEKCKAALRLLPALERAHAYRRRALTALRRLRLEGPAKDGPSFQEVAHDLVRAMERFPHLVQYANRCEVRARVAMADAAKGRALLRTVVDAVEKLELERGQRQREDFLLTPLDEAEEYLATSNPGQESEAERERFHAAIQRMEERNAELWRTAQHHEAEARRLLARCEALAGAGAILSEEVEKLREDMEALSKGPDGRLVSRWRRLRTAGPEIFLLWADDACQVRAARELPLEELDAELVVAGLLRVSPVSPVADEPQQVRATVVRLDVLEKPHPEVSHYLYVDRTSPASLAVCLYDALAEVLNFKLFSRGPDLSRTFLLMQWVRRAVERLRPPSEPV